MSRTKRKVSNRAKTHIAGVKKARKRRIRASGATRNVHSRRARRARKLAAK
ncbi:MAG: hypothetical protein JNM83_11250 [Myxococcales bacterium]|jgi:hypothetical protein|nr:hypothetical protein [Myxococcales bacterium]